MVREVEAVARTTTPHTLRRLTPPEGRRNPPPLPARASTKHRRNDTKGFPDEADPRHRLAPHPRHRLAHRLTHQETARTQADPKGAPQPTTTMETRRKAWSRRGPEP